MTRALHLHVWGEEERAPVVCLHGVTAWGGHFAGLAEGLADTHRVLAPDLLGHGSSSWEPPWRIADHVTTLAATLDARPAVWLGHSFGARLALEVAAAMPERVHRLVLLDPAILLPPQVALWAAENARRERVYASFAEAIDRRYEESQLVTTDRATLEEELGGHLVESGDGWRYRYSQAAVVVAHSELATPPPAFEDVRIPTLVVLGDSSYLPYDHLVDEHRAALGDLLEIVTVPGGHTLLWDAPGETVGAVARFLG